MRERNRVLLHWRLNVVLDCGLCCLLSSITCYYERKKCRNERIVFATFRFKAKVGADIEDDRRRCRLIRKLIGPNNILVSKSERYLVSTHKIIAGECWLLIIRQWFILWRQTTVFLPSFIIKYYNRKIGIWWW